ncbi:uncharacterized protein LOC110734910 [Chenopodium quinoa]|uniref:uncharacterized protein LOC110734910 n=1 Tax=Chenopodium quinoa TaxID=63459 RepID=UPI000B786AB2|nr:uncharacterized protein LOC110734910 [Chenopodium quinoa]
MAGGSGNNNDGGELSVVVRQLAAIAQQLENWLREFEKLFGAVGCPENSEVGCATYYLRGEADLWWQQNEATIKLLNTTPSLLSCHDLLRSLFLQKKSKARKFESGLTTDLQLKLCGQVFETLDEVYGRASHLYALELKKKKEIAETKGREKRKEKRGGTEFWKPIRNSSQGNNKGARHFYCKRCKNDHPGKDCDGNLVTCQACNKLGHRKYECFSKDPNRNRQGNNKGGVQKSFQGSNNYSGYKGAQQNTVKPNNNNGNNQQKGRAAGKLNVMSRHEADSTKYVITSTFSIKSIPIKVLFDSGATFSFISKAIVLKLSNCLKTVDEVDLPIVISTGGVVKCNKIFRDVPLEIEGKVFLPDLIEFGLSDFNVILGMDWLSKYSVEISC